MKNQNNIQSVYRSISSYYGRIFPITQEKMRFINPIINSNSTILDVGCSTGELPLNLAPLCRSVTGIDPAGESIEIASENLKKTSSRNVDFRICKMEQVSSGFENSSFSHILCLGNTLAHIDREEDLPSIFNGFFKILKPGGFLILQVVNYRRVLGFQDFAFMPLKKERVIFQRHYCPVDIPGKIEFHTKLKDYETGFYSTNSCLLSTLRYPVLKKSLNRSRFINIRGFGNFSRIPWTINSGSLLISCRKPLNPR